MNDLDRLGNSLAEPPEAEKMLREAAKESVINCFISCCWTTAGQLWQMKKQRLQPTAVGFQLAGCNVNIMTMLIFKGNFTGEIKLSTEFDFFFFKA